MKMTTWWILGVTALGAIAGAAAVGTGDSSPGGVSLPLSALDAIAEAPPDAIASSRDIQVTESTSSTSTIASALQGTRIVFAYTSSWDEASTEALISQLIGQGFSELAAEAALIESETSQVRVEPGFDEAAAVVLSVVGLSAEAIVETDPEVAWSALDGQADIVVLLGSDLRD